MTISPTSRKRVRNALIAILSFLLLVAFILSTRTQSHQPKVARYRETKRSTGAQFEPFPAELRRVQIFSVTGRHRARR